MPSCLRCGQPVDRHDEICTTCHPEGKQSLSRESGDAIPDEESITDPTGLAVARFESMAEAGFFADQLVRRHGIETTLSVDETFDAITGHWSVRFILNVPEDQASSASVLLENLVQTHDEDFPASPDVPENTFDIPADDSPAVWQVDENEEAGLETGMNWFPLVLTLAAGGAAVWGLRAWNGREAARVLERQHAPDLWDELGHDSSPWIQESEENRAVRKLWVDADGRGAILREDRDGDGIFERETRLKRESASP
jgi:hypothetical protein